jgi:hypothetical protein
MISRDPDVVEDEGYVAAENGLGLEQNPYPSGTLRHADWRRGWQTRQTERRTDQDPFALSVDPGKTLADNPHPKGTIRFEEWRRALLLKQSQARRAVRLGRSCGKPPGS